MKKFLALSLCLALSLLAATPAAAKTIKVPEKKALVSFEVPNSWSVEDLEKGVMCESKDEVVTILFEVTGGKGIEKLIDENIEWLTKEHKVDIDAATKSEADFKAGGLEWSRLSFKCTHKDTGAGRVAFIFSDIGGGKILLITYWITEEGMTKHIPSINALFESFRRL